VEVDVVSEWVEFESECHALKYHLLIEVWCAKGNLTEAINKSPERLILFLSHAKKGDGCSLMWAAASEVSGEHVGEGVEVIDGVWRKGGKPFEGRAFKGGREGLAENGIVRSVEGDVGDIDLEGRNHLRENAGWSVKYYLVPHGGRQLFLRRTNKICQTQALPYPNSQSPQ